MPRKNRIWYPGAIYHIICRGNNKQDIFRDEKDRSTYLSILREVKINHHFLLYAYCLMSNHVHLHLETAAIEIGRTMKLINMHYAVYFNKKYQLTGHLFQDRFRSELVDKDGYNLEISRYIHLNPVRANLVSHPRDYPWSSYRAYLSEQEDDLVTKSKILGYFQNQSPLHYQKFVEENT